MTTATAKKTRGRRDAGTRREREEGEVLAAVRDQWHRYPIETGGEPCGAWLLAAEDGEGQWFGTPLVRWRGPLKLPDLDGAVKPAEVPHFATEVEALTAVGESLIGWTMATAPDFPGLGSACLQRLRSSVAAWLLDVDEYVAARVWQTAEPSQSGSVGRVSEPVRTASESRPTAAVRTASESRPTVVEGPRLVDVEVELCDFVEGSPDPSEAEIVEMTGWLKESGQRQAVTAVESDGGRYLVIDGKTRHAGARQLGWETIRAEVWPAGDDLGAAVQGGVANTQRRTETAWRQALWLKLLIDRHGLSVKAAAAKFGHKESWAATRLGLLRLGETKPGKVWIERLISGEMSDGAVTALIPYAEHAELLKAFDEDYRQAEQTAKQYGELNAWQDRDQVRYAIADSLHGMAKPLDRRQLTFKRTAEVDAQMEVAKFPTGQNGALEEWTLKPDVFAELQQAGEKGRANGQADKAREKDAKEGNRRLAPCRSPVEAREAAKRKAELLAARVRYWRHRWLLRLVAPLMSDADEPTGDVAALLLTADHDRAAMAVGSPKRVDVLRGAMEDIGLSSWRLKREKEWKPVDTDQTWGAIRATPGVRTSRQITGAFVRRMLALEDKGPEWPVIPYVVADDLAIDYQIDIAAAWAEVQRNGERPHFEAFLRLFQREELVLLAKEWGMSPLDKWTRKQVLENVLQAPRSFPLPACLAALSGKALAAGAKSSKPKKG